MEKKIPKGFNRYIITCIEFPEKTFSEVAKDRKSAWRKFCVMRFGDLKPSPLDWKVELEDSASLKIDDVVTYAKIKETQSIDHERRNALGVVKELDVIDGERVARIEWDYSPGSGFWVRTGLLERGNR